MCKSSGETVNHLLLHCPIAWELWTMVLIIFGTSWVMPWGVEDLLCCWTGAYGKSEADKTWKMTPHCLMWCLWQERNDRTFKGVENSIPALKFKFLLTLLEWSKASHLDSSCSSSDMIAHCSVCFLFLYSFLQSGSLPVHLYCFPSFFNEILIYQKKQNLPSTNPKTPHILSQLLAPIDDPFSIQKAITHYPVEHG